MKKDNIPIALAPLPLIVILLVLCYWIIISPEDSINGKNDNAPDRAATALIIWIPIIIYPLMVISIFIQSLIMKVIHQTNIIGCIFVGSISIIPVAIFLAKVTHAPEFGESLPKAIIYSIGMLSIMSCMTLLTFLGIKKITDNQSMHAKKC